MRFIILLLPLLAACSQFPKPMSSAELDQASRDNFGKISSMRAQDPKKFERWDKHKNDHDVEVLIVMPNGGKFIAGDGK